MPRLTILFVLLLIAIIAAADLGSARAALDLVRLVPAGDEIGHLVLVGMLSFLVNASLRARRTRVFGLKVLTGSLVLAAVMALEEASRVFLANRTASLTDLACNLSGIVVGGGFALPPLPSAPDHDGEPRLRASREPGPRPPLASLRWTADSPGEPRACRHGRNGRNGRIAGPVC